MKKFVDGFLFDTDEADGFITTRIIDFQGRETIRRTLWRTKKGEWIREDTEDGSSSLKRISAKDAAEICTRANKDLPDVLVSDLEGYEKPP